MVTASGALSKFTGKVPSKWLATAGLRTMSFFKIPMIFLCRPTVIELTDERCVVRLPLRRVTRNHLNSMYFGALCVGADCTGGIQAWRLIDESGHKISLVFKDFKAEFLKRPEADVHFISTQGLQIKELVQQAIASGERVSMPVQITATCPKKFGDEPVAQFTLTLSLKKK